MISTEKAVALVRSYAEARDRAQIDLRDAGSALEEAVRSAYAIPGISLGRIAAEAGLSRSRIHQIVKETR